eukprot:757289-Pleurochrysis_carterae.AAC.1
MAVLLALPCDDCTMVAASIPWWMAAFPRSSLRADVCIFADYPAAAALGGFVKSTSAQCFCRECNLSRNHPSERTRSWISPNSFVSGVSKLIERTFMGHKSEEVIFESLDNAQLQEDQLRLNG